MTELQKRLLSSAVLVPVAVACLWYGRWAYDALILAVMVGMVWEGATLLGQKMRCLRGALLLLWPFCAGVLAIKEQWLSVLYLALAALFFGVRLWGAVLVSLIGGSALLYLRARPDGLYETLFVMAVVVASDSSAYAVGRLIGGAKLAPSISPGKTISGSIGGLVGAALMGGVIAYCAMGHWCGSAFLWGAVVGVAAQCGDLGESAFKRRLGVKDSGALIPGHGGLLDRFDGLLLAAPLAALIAFLSHHKPLWLLGVG
ncbi:phosphatidate cytidylyltransferase [Saccharibacter floricola]|uniref:Phosphatidate cytidylyltransferase n=1 Tax=Saccharibacter floricola DSM 15669 TaxID=1123227 RepID=A0ABQ0NYR4_9PROT|nr:phosphatidate cytidylyltransferase [Saccharibacter floricola]GBQ06813.1 phosphatidate cytidylyltransferase [Saccharibacter floricola DSM 15669]